MTPAQLRAARLALAFDMQRLAEALTKGGGILSADELVAALPHHEPAKALARVRRFVAEGWLDPEGAPLLDDDERDAAERRWLRGEGRFQLGAVRLWMVDIDDEQLRTPGAP